ncbi:GDSL-type esterase/lipase family protein [Methylomonas methanica]|uniref:Lipolytic protein G-D-S-L family n=1 Tax=Methylomonas methanica (strain DSM 25384 / MC09) TaxID=857087 RepID=F9ZYV1_METMM|nr:GDSL-type esterase/lipase family protein [Methylomonas methanica]AEF98647.1 lipolytic protein G-D-S-L family [Methylomonas methanica MC09]
MKKWIIGFSLLSLFACGKEAPKLGKLPEEAVILAFGDSLTYGTGASAEHAYPSILTALTGREVINEGVPGEISREGRQRLPRLLDEYHPNLLILIHGGNDILQQINVAETRENLKAMIAEAKQRDIPVVMLGVPKFGLISLHSAEIYAELAQSEQVPIDLETLPNILSTNSLKSDTVHPNEQGYQKLAENIATLLREQGAL